jgi:Fe-S-cluster containining protein
MKNRLKVLSDDKPWYAEGLRFKCTECGQCCTGAPGYAWVNDDEIQAIADYLKMDVKAFGKKYLRFVQGRYALVERKNYDCIFLKDRKCSVYPVRPSQCRTFPWWVQNLTTPEAWKEAAQYCEGINDEAPLVPIEIIESQLNIDKEDA